MLRHRRTASLPVPLPSNPTANINSRRASLADITNSHIHTHARTLHNNKPTPTPTTHRKPGRPRTRKRLPHPRAAPVPPIYCLPAELLLHIAHLGTSPRSPDFPILFSHICHHFRVLALSSQHLWSALPLASSFHTPSPPGMIRELVDRSVHGLVDVALDLGPMAGRPPPREATAVWRTKELAGYVAPCVGRWRSLRVSLPSFACLEAFFNACTAPAPLLEELTIFAFDAPRSLTEAPFLNAPTPKLHTLRLQGVFLPLRSALLASPALQTLHLAHLPPHTRPSLPALLHLLSHLPALRSLTLIDAIPPPPLYSSSSPAPILLPSLEALDLSSTPAPIAHPFLLALYAPALRALTLGSAPPAIDDVTPLLALLPVRYAGLEKLRIGMGRVEQGAVEGLCARMKALRWVVGPTRGKDADVGAANRRWEEGYY